MEDFLLFLAVGVVAQVVDGALGMAYGVISSTVLLAFGVTPAHASVAVHAAELFTTAASGSAYLYHRNVDWPLFWRLAPFGLAGGALGAYARTSFDGEMVKPLVTADLGVVGAWLFFRSFRKLPTRPVRATFVAPLGAVGGFLDAAGGGGWGPIVTTGLLGAGGAPRYVIGTVNASEFLITLAVSLSFLVSLLSRHWEMGGALASHASSVGGLIVGGLLAGPFAGWVVRALPENRLLRVIGLLIVALAVYQTVALLGRA